MLTNYYMEIIKELTTEYFKSTFDKYGDSPKGVDWNGKESQDLRFKIILDEISTDTSFSILDVGCGTGALLNYLIEKRCMNFKYTGIDFVKEMILAAQEKYKDRKNIKFANQGIDSMQGGFDYVVSSGIFNAKLSTDENTWNAYMLEVINKMFASCNKAVIFNVLTSYVDFKVEKLHYSDPKYIFDYCKCNLSKFVKINHSYPLFEYTMTIFKEDYIKSLYK